MCRSILALKSGLIWAYSYEKYMYMSIYIYRTVMSYIVCYVEFINIAVLLLLLLLLLYLIDLVREWRGNASY